MCQYDCFHMCMNTPICDSFYNGTLNVCVPVSAFRCLHVCVCARAKVCFCSSVSAQYPSAAKPSINLSTPQPTVSPFLFPLAFLPSFPFISHLTLSLTKPPPPLSYFIPVTYSQSHFRHYRTMLPPLDKKHACVLSMFFTNKRKNGSFFSASLCTLDFSWFKSETSINLAL